MESKYLIFLVALFFLGWWRIDSLNDSLKAEQRDHKETKEARDEAVKKGNGWKKAYEEAIDSAQAHRKETQACLDREVEARTAQQEREKILQTARTRTRTAEEKLQVVDDATHKSTVRRLNRPL